MALYEKGKFAFLGHDWSDNVEQTPLESVGFQIPELVNGHWKGENVKEKEWPDKGLFEPHAIPRLKVYSPDGKTERDVAFNLINTDRRRLGQKLVQQAEKAGALVYYRHRGLYLLYCEFGKRLDKIEIYGVKIENLDTGEVETFLLMWWWNLQAFIPY